MDSERIWEKLQKGVFVIAEIGKNFIQIEDERSVDEYLENAKKLVEYAIWAGADAVKFQTHHLEDEILANANYISPHFANFSKGRYAWVERNWRMTPVDGFWRPLKKYVESRGLIFFSTPMSRGAAKILNEVGVNLWKIGSGDMLDFVMLDYMRNTDKPIILSSGMSTLEEVTQAFWFLKRRNSRVALLHCVSKYPCPPEDLRLGAMPMLREKFGAPTGFSDHSITVDSAVAAAALGATIIEKHFSLARELWGPDHKASLTPAEFREMVRQIREVESNLVRHAQVLDQPFVKAALTRREKILQEGEKAFRPLFRKSLMAGCDIPAGTILAPEMVYAMRPQNTAGGLPSERYPEVIGWRVGVSLKKYDPITESVLG